MTLSTALYTSAFTNLLFGSLPERSSFRSRIQWFCLIYQFGVSQRVLRPRALLAQQLEYEPY